MGLEFDLIDRSRWRQIADPGPSLTPGKYKALKAYGRTLKACTSAQCSLVGQCKYTDMFLSVNRHSGLFHYSSCNCTLSTEQFKNCKVSMASMDHV